MKILHTSDWHLSLKHGQVDRQPDIEERLKEIAGYLDQHQVDVMLVSGDLFSNASRLDQARSAFEKVYEIFRPFLLRGGTMIAVGGNHDGEDLFGMCRTAMNLASPYEVSSKVPKTPGRLYLYDRKGYMTLKNGNNGLVQFVLLPYPHPTRYLEEEDLNFKTIDELNGRVGQAVVEEMRKIRARYVDPKYPTVLVSHLHVRGNSPHNLFHISESKSVVVDPSVLPMEWAYLAFGHIHLPQKIRGNSRAQYAGSIDRFDFGEMDDPKSVVLLEIDQSGVKGEPIPLPLNATPLYRIEVHSPDEIDQLAARYPDSHRAIADVKIFFKPGIDNPDAMRAALEKIFPRWADRKIEAEGADFEPVSMDGVPHNTDDIHATVRSYLAKQLEGHADREDLLALAEEMLAGM